MRGGGHKESKARSTVWAISLSSAIFLLPAMGTSIPAAEKYPTKSINMIVPYAPASGADLGSKIMADRMGEFLGESMVSVYKPGGGGSLGAAFVAKARPDGYTAQRGGFGLILLKMGNAHCGIKNGKIERALLAIEWVER
jgi:tripartite-type tricarboxylate transporter receptor subunit TctC